MGPVRRNSVQIGRAFLDINVGMNRTGVLPGPEAIARYKLIYEMPFLDVRGLHVYDGHIFGLAMDDRTKRGRPKPLLRSRQ